MLNQDAREQPAMSHHLEFHVVTPANSVVTGRLLIFVQKITEPHPDIIEVDLFHPLSVFVAAAEIFDAEPGTRLDINVDENAYPAPFSTLEDGEYLVQAVLDVDHSYSCGGIDATDWISEIMNMTLRRWPDGRKEEIPALVLSQHPPASPAIAESKSEIVAGRIEELNFSSSVLTRFYGHDTHITGAIALPPGYDPRSDITYPVVYWTHGFGKSHPGSILQGAAIRRRMETGHMPAMIWVMLDQNLATGTHEFTDSFNNGPWGTALTKELIPNLEHRYKMDSSPTGRFLNGHSSGGWATLQLQINYPEIFGGTWSTSPDSSDFHSFNGVDLYESGANLFLDHDGNPHALVRVDGKAVTTFEQFSRLEEVLGTEGAQLNSFDWVFSPRGENGRPLRMFDRTTGKVNPEVVRFWGEHYDLVNILYRNWKKNGSILKDKIHVYVGTADTFYLDGAVHRLDIALQQLGGSAHIVFLPGRDHFNIYEDRNDPMALFDTIAREMYAIARP